MSMSIPYEVAINGKTEEYVRLTKQLQAIRELRQEERCRQNKLLTQIASSSCIRNSSWTSATWIEALSLHELSKELVEVTGYLQQVDSTIEDYKKQINSIGGKVR